MTGQRAERMIGTAGRAKSQRSIALVCAGDVRPSEQKQRVAGIYKEIP
jgi:hypothetical protein